MSIRDDLRQIAFDVRSIPGELGIRPYTVAAVVQEWSGSVLGEGTETVTSTAIVEANGQSPKVRWLTGEEVALGGFQTGSVEVGPITPDFPGGGTLIATLTGSAVATGKLLYFVLTGPEFPSGARYALRDFGSDRAIHYTLTLQPIAEQ